MPSLEHATVADAMHPGMSGRSPRHHLKPSMPLRDAGELMLTHGVSHLVVTDAEAGGPIGLLSTLDVAGVLAWGEE